MTDEEIFVELVGYLKTHRIKDLMELVLKAIELLDAK